MASDSFVFPAIFAPGEDGGYRAAFPDFPGLTVKGESLEKSLTAAKATLEFHLYQMELNQSVIPDPTPANSPAFIIPDDGFISLVEANMTAIREKMAGRAAEKPRVAPRWINNM